MEVMALAAFGNYQPLACQLEYMRVYCQNNEPSFPLRRTGQRTIELHCCLLYARKQIRSSQSCVTLSIALLGS